MASFDQCRTSIRVPPPLQGQWGPPGSPLYQPQPHPFGNASYQSFDPSEIRSSYSLCISGVVPRPIALTSTLSVDGTRNIAPFSYFNIVSHDPPHVALGICKNPDGSKKDTLRNIEDTKEFVINIMSDWYVESANHCCGNFAPEEDELQRSGLMNPIPSQVVKPCRLAESAFHMVNMKSRFLFFVIIHVLCHIHSSYLCLYTMNTRNVSW